MTLAEPQAFKILFFFPSISNYWVLCDQHYNLKILRYIAGYVFILTLLNILVNTSSVEC